MALAALIVRIGADTSDLDKGLTRANRNVEQFGKKLRPMGASLTRIGNSASMAAGSLSRLGGVMPGVVGGMGRVVGTLGTAGIVLGETTILAAGLTKGMRLLQAASLAVAASSAPAWLAALATPAGIAIAGIAALTATVWGLKKAWDAVTGSGANKRLMEIGASASSHTKGRLMMAAAPQHSAPSGGTETAFMQTLAQQVQLVAKAWDQMQEGMAPIKNFTSAWSGALQSVQSQLAIVGNSLSADAVLLRDMLHTLREIGKQFPKGIPKLGIPAIGATPSEMTINAKSPTLPDPDPSKVSRFQRTKFAVQDAASGFGSDAMSMISMAFNPLIAVMPVITGIFQALSPILEPLVPIFESLGQIIGTLLAPVIRAVAVGLSFLAEALGWVIRAIGRLIDAIPGISAKGLINSGQAMIDAAKAARRNADATDNATDKVNEFAGALSNIPRVLNLNALRHLVGGGSTPPVTTPPGSTPGDPDKPKVKSIGSIEINVYGATNARETAEMIGRELDRRLSRGGTSRLGLSLA